MILVVDDDVDVREALCEILADEGYEVAGARNGSEALGLLQQPRSVCLMLLDLMMPVMTGYQVLEKRRADPKLANVPVVVMSAFWDCSQDIGCVDFLPKPLALAAVLSFAERYCKGERGEGFDGC